MPRAVVTGAAGFTGFSVTRELLSRNYEVFAILKPGSSHNSRIGYLNGSIHSIELDCSDYYGIPDLVRKECDVFINLAWFGGKDDFDVQRMNIDHCIMSVKSASELHCRRYIGIGSQAEYGSVNSIQTENLSPCPITAYGAAKVTAMFFSKILAEQLGIEWIWGRIFSLYGDYEPKGRMLPDLIRKMTTGEDIILSSCKQNWDYLHVQDAACAIADLAEKGKSGEIYNIAHGDYKKLREFTEIVRRLLNYKGDINYGADPFPFITLQPDVTKLKLHTGWKPAVSFDDGVLKYFEENKNDWS